MPTQRTQSRSSARPAKRWVLAYRQRPGGDQAIVTPTAVGVTS